MRLECVRSGKKDGMSGNFERWEGNRFIAIANHILIVFTNLLEVAVHKSALKLSPQQRRVTIVMMWCHQRSWPKNTFKSICSGSSFLRVRFQGHFWVVEGAECDDSGNGNTVEMFVNFGTEEVN